jgi:hypothetical protein
MSDLEPAPEPAQAHPAGVIAIENPYNDPITIAHSAVDVYQGLIAEQTDEVERMRAKVERAEIDLAAARMALDESLRRGPVIEAQLGAALAELNKARQDDPELADRLEADRGRQMEQRRRELLDELEKLGGA